MNLDEFCKNIPNERLCKETVSKLLSELIQSENAEEPYSWWYEEKVNEVESDWKELYYIVTNKRFLEISIDSGSFSCQSYSLKQLKSFKERVVPHKQDLDAFEDSAYFSGGEGVSSYTVEFSFSVAEEKSNTTMFSFSTSESWNDKRLQELRNFVKGFHKAVTGL